MGNTHIDLHSDNSNDTLSGVPDGKEDDENELHGQIEHTALDDDIDGSPACPCRELRTVHVACPTRREVPNAPGDEGGHDHVRSNGRVKAARPSGTREGGAIGEFGFMRSRRSRTTLTHTDTKKWLVSARSLPLSLRPYLGSKFK